MTLFGFSEPVVRFSIFILILSTMALFELLHPRLEREELRGALKAKRWFTNISMLILSSICLRIIFPAAAVGTAIFFKQEDIGLFNILEVPFAFAFILSFVILDFIIWLEHVASHKIALLWRIHRMHHADQGFDVTTALRFHPLEIVLSMIWKIVIIGLIGAPAAAVLIFEVVLNGMAMFNHANVKLPLPLDRALRLIVVTPDMHRVHHSADPEETDTNYGFNFSIWDKLFSTYRAQPKVGQIDIDIGLRQFRDQDTSHLIWAILIPFRRK